MKTAYYKLNLHLNDKISNQYAVINSRRYQIFGEVVGLERGPLSLVSTTEELTEWYV
jgi:hypothetical protein